MRERDLCDRKGACERACDRLCSRMCVDLIPFEALGQMWSWTFCRLCPAKSCSLLTVPDITTNTQLENSPEQDRIHRSNPSQWNGCTHGTPTRWENRATDPPHRLSPSTEEASPSSMQKVLPRYREQRCKQISVFLLPQLQLRTDWESTQKL